MLLLKKELIKRRSRRKLYSYYPDLGPLRRSLYKKHMEFFRAGATHRERGFIAANRIGKSEGAGGYETTLHLTGRYPDWWKGRRFERSVSAWAVGESSKDVRDSIQKKMIGPMDNIGTGLIPADDIVSFTKRAGTPEAIDKVVVKNRFSDQHSELTFKSYDQGRESFQSVEMDVIWLDEECPEQIYSECVLRTMTTRGIVMLTFTPLKGLSRVVLKFLPGGKIPAQDMDMAA